jgi:hypothetical protein
VVRDVLKIFTRTTTTDYGPPKLRRQDPGKKPREDH